MESCDHPQPALCEALGKHIHGHLWNHWNTRGDYRLKWSRDVGADLQELEQKFPPTGPVEPAAPSRCRAGTELKKLFASIGIAPKENCLCDKHAARMDQEGCDWCEENIETIVDWLAEEASKRPILGVFFSRAAARLAVKRAIARARGSQVPTTHPIGKHVSKWAVGITTAYRKVPTLMRCYQSAVKAGFEPVVFAEPDTNGPLPPGTVVRPQKLGCWRNWIQTLRDLLERFPEAHAVMILQDDCVMSRDVRSFLEHDLWPSEKTGLVSIYSCNWPGYEQANVSGCLRVKGKFLMGAVANIFPRKVAEEIAKTQDWRGHWDAKVKVDDPVKKKAVDTFVGHEIARLGLGVFYYTPSLCQHVSTHSAIGHGGAVGKRRSQKFAGENSSAFDQYPPPWVRFNLPSGNMRFARPEGWMPSSDPVAVVIPAVDCEGLTKRCLDHLAANAGHPVEVIYVDNGSVAGVADEIEKHSKSLGLPTKVIRNKTNLGFTVATNQGIRAAGDRHVLLLNNDTRITPGCLPRMLWHLEAHPRVAATGPLSDDRGHQSINRAPRRKHQGRNRVSEEVMLTGFCCLKNKAALKEIGLLDEHPDFAGGLGTDDDWCKRARNCRPKWRLLLCYDAFCHHDHSSTFKQLELNRSAMQRRAMDRLRRKPVETIVSKTPEPPRHKPAPLSIDFRTYDQMAADTRAWAQQLKSRIGAVCGIPRSGLLPAAIIAQELMIPMVTIESLLSGSGSYRPDGSRDLGSADLPTLVVDDSLSSGATMMRVRDDLKGIPGLLFGAVYDTGIKPAAIDLSASTIQHPHTFEWTVLRDASTELSCVDMDGVLCQDWSGPEDGEAAAAYQQHLQHAKPLAKVTRKIHRIVTGRLEAWRDETEEWLQKHGIQCDELVMYPGLEPQERGPIADWKAEVYQQHPGAVLFIESDRNQSTRIFELTGRPVLCYSTMEFWP